jgi:hypothetical protein
MILFTIGLVGLSVIVSYYFWTRMRIVRLQQDILDMRDELFAEAHRLQCLDDGAYCETREFFNNFIQFAPHLSVRIVMYVGLQTVGDEDARRRSSNPVMQDAIERAYQRLAQRTFNFLAHETAGGFVLRIAAEFVLGLPFLGSAKPEVAVNKKTEDAVRRNITSATFSRIVNENCALS